MCFSSTAALCSSHGKNQMINLVNDQTHIICFNTLTVNGLTEKKPLVENQAETGAMETSGDLRSEINK